jgi:hypothetical protein
MRLDAMRRGERRVAPDEELPCITDRSQPHLVCTKTVAFPRGGKATCQHSNSSGNRNALAGWRCFCGLGRARESFYAGDSLGVLRGSTYSIA